jgi:predicted nucleic acid-binding protein
MKILLDTNILTRSAEPSHPQHGLAVRSVSSLRTRGDTLFLLPQNLYEFWVVATRPHGENGFGMNAQAAAERLKLLKRSFTVLEETPQVFATWEVLVVQNSAKGKSAHDTRLVAGMKVNGLAGILTFNEEHFGRYGGITVLTPAGVAQSSDPQP